MRTSFDRARIRAVLAGLTMGAGALAAAAPPAPIEIAIGWTADGAPTELWSAAIRRLHGDETAAAAAAGRRLPDPVESAWEEAFRERRFSWEARRDALEAPFEPVSPPASVRIVLGVGGAEDAFTHDPHTIGFDLARLAAEYGDATTAENVSRLDRFFAHEYTHLLQKAWLVEHPQPQETPFERAELGIWLEGLGNYYSLSDRWRSVGGEESAASRAARAELEPILVARMQALACASPEDERRLVADLSMGPFTHKWGALPAALWLELEASRSPDALRAFVAGGVASVRELASRYLSGERSAALEAASLRSVACGHPSLSSSVLGRGSGRGSTTRLPSRL